MEPCWWCNLMARFSQTKKVTGPSRPSSTPSEHGWCSPELQALRTEKTPNNLRGRALQPPAATLPRRERVPQRPSRCPTFGITSLPHAFSERHPKRRFLPNLSPGGAVGAKYLGRWGEDISLLPGQRLQGICARIKARTSRRTGAQSRTLLPPGWGSSGVPDRPFDPANKAPFPRWSSDQRGRALPQPLGAAHPVTLRRDSAAAFCNPPVISPRC